MRREALALRLAERIYEAAVEPATWDETLRELSEALGDAAIQLSLRIREAEAALVARPTSEPGPVFRIHLDEKYHEIFLRLSIRDFPWPSIDRHAVLERFVRSDQMVEHDLDLENSAFYLEFMKPQGLVLEAPLAHVIASIETRPLAGMVIYRREGCRPFAPADFALLDLLVPHLARAYAVHSRLGEARHEQRALREVLDRFPSGVMLLDKDSRVVLTNRSADQILAQDDGIRLDHGCPRLADPRQDRVFQQLLAEAVQTRAVRGHSHGKTTTVLRPSGRRSYASMVGPLLAPPPGTSLREAVAILFVSDPEGSQISTSEVLEGLYDLTPAEAELLRLLAEGRSLEEVAVKRGVTINTARSQLKQVFAKTDTRRQGELVRLVLSGVASLGDDGGR
jgi:DNA-binding CsgD family transcriptional regulator